MKDEYDYDYYSDFGKYDMTEYEKYQREEEERQDTLDNAVLRNLGGIYRVTV